MTKDFASVDLPAPPDNEIVEGQESYIVNECSGHVTWHSPGCDEKCPKNELPVAAILIRNEKNAWMRAGMATENVVHDVWNIDVQVLALIQLLEDLGICTKDQLNDMYRKKYLEKLKDFRAMHEEGFRKARTMQDIAIARKQVLGPNGEILN